MLHALEVYSMPSLTSGVASTPRNVSRSYDHARPSLPTLCSSISFKGLKRCSEYVRPYVIQFAESPSAARSAASSTSLVLRAHPAIARIQIAADTSIKRRDKVRRITSSAQNYKFGPARQGPPC